MVLALPELIAAWNCWLQSENWMPGAADELADTEVLALADDDLTPVVGGVLGRLEEVQDVPASSTAATSTTKLFRRRVNGTR